MNEYLARTDKRGAQGAGVPVVGRLGTALSWKEVRAGVTGESTTVESRPCNLRERTLLFFVPQENMMIMITQYRQILGFMGFSPFESREGK